MKDLTTIPTKYQILFDCDWNTGNDSKMTIMDRAKLADLYLDYNKWHVSQQLKLRQPQGDMDYLGGFSDKDDIEDKHQGFVF